MPDILLVAETRQLTGSANSRRLRHHHHVPAVVYGHDVESTPISVESRALRAALSTPAGRNAVFELEVAGTRHLAMAKVVDHHPVRHTIAHVDFLVISRDETVTADVPITIVGEAAMVLREGGAVEQVLHALTVTMLPGSIPDAIEVDVADLEPGGTIRVSDLNLPSGVTTALDGETPVVSAAQAPTVEAEGEAPTEAATEAEAAAPES